MSDVNRQGVLKLLHQKIDFLNTEQMLCDTQKWKSYSSKCLCGPIWVKVIRQINGFHAVKGSILTF